MIYVAIGANLPGPHGALPQLTCRWAVDQLAALPGLRLVAVARWHETAPDPPSDQPTYINGAAAFDGSVAPEWLLAALQAIERAAGRMQGGPRNAARPLDLDIIDIDGICRDSPDPILPHPRAHLRSFVLEPLRDIAPDWVHPRTGTSIDTLLAALRP